MAGQAQKRGLPPQLPLMAALVESGLKNLNHGHADSVGFFQMRVGIWNQGAYAGYPEKPELQVKWFLDQAEAVKKQRHRRRQADRRPGALRRVDRRRRAPRRAVPRALPEQLAEANQLLASAPQQPAAAPAARRAGAIRPPRRRARPRSATRSSRRRSSAPVQDAIAAGNAPGPKALAAIEEASKYIGTDYKWGGSTPQTGFDCSGLMQWSYAQSGVQIPRVTYTQIEAPNGTEVADRSSLKPGDLVFFSNAGDVHHVGMYLGDQKFLHAPSTGDVVKVSSLDEPYYAGQFAGGRRFDDERAGRRRARRGRRPRSPPRRRAVDPTDGRQGAGRRRARRRRGAPPGLRAVPGGQGRGGDQGEREAPVGAVPEGDRPVAGQAPGRGAAPPGRRPR